MEHIYGLYLILKKQLKFLKQKSINMQLVVTMDYGYVEITINFLTQI